MVNGRRWIAFMVLAIIALFPTPGATAIAPAVEDDFAQASRESSVPVAILMAVSYAETRWEDHGVWPSAANGFGIMHLQNNDLNHGLLQAAALISRPPALLKSSRAANIRGGAALLRQEYLSAYPNDAAMAHANALGRWFVPAGSYLRSDNAQPQRDFAERVFAFVERGVQRTINGRTLRLPPAGELQPDRGKFASVPDDLLLATARLAGNRKGASLAANHVQGGADEFYGSTLNYDSRSGNPTGLVMHTCWAPISNCLNTLTNPSSGVSAHYVVRSADGWRYQLVHREMAAWHCGDCSEPPYGSSWNAWTVGIELEGYQDNPGFWYTSTMYSRTAWLAAWACFDYSMGGCLQYDGFYGHDYAQPGNSDPGGGFDWYWFANTCTYERLQFIRYSYPIQYCP